jgi:CRP/FNR family transcriptional regulator, cyclic AMP receptor protein
MALQRVDDDMRPARFLPRDRDLLQPLNQVSMSHSNPSRPATVHSGIFAGISEDAIAEIFAAAKPRRVAAKQTIITAGEKATHLFVLQTGRGRYFKLSRTGNEVLLQLLTLGDAFGIGTLLENPCPYIGSAQATSEAEMLVWEHARIRQLATLHPQLANNALRIVLQYLKRYVDRHVGLVTKTAEQRLGETLLGLGHKTGRIHPGGVHVEVTNGELGALADRSPRSLEVEKLM